MALEPYPGEMLSDMIERALMNGVAPEMGAPLAYDEDDAEGVDPSSDIRTYLFDIAENAVEQRAAASEMSNRANSTPAPVRELAEPTPSHPEVGQGEGAGETTTN